MKVQIGKLVLGKFTPRLPRRDYKREHVAEISKSLKEHGQWHEVLVNQRLEVIDGETRVEAAKRLGWREVEAKVLKVTNEAAHIIALSSNIMQKNLDFMEEAEKIKFLHDEGLSVRKIAKQIGKDKSWVDRRLRAAKELHPEIKALLSHRETKTLITPKHAEHLARLPKRDQLIIAREVEDKKLTAEETEVRVKDALTAREVIPTSHEETEAPSAPAPAKPEASSGVIPVTEVGLRIRENLLDLETLHLFKDFSYRAIGTCPECGKRTTLDNPKIAVQAWKKDIVEAMRKDLEELSN